MVAVFYACNTDNPSRAVFGSLKAQMPAANPGQRAKRRQPEGLFSKNY